MKNGDQTSNYVTLESVRRLLKINFIVPRKSYLINICANSLAKLSKIKFCKVEVGTQVTRITVLRKSYLVILYQVVKK